MEILAQWVVSRNLSLLHAEGLASLPKRRTVGCIVLPHGLDRFDLQQREGVDGRGVACSIVGDDLGAPG